MKQHTITLIYRVAIVASSFFLKKYKQLEQKQMVKLELFLIKIV